MKGAAERHRGGGIHFLFFFSLAYGMFCSVLLSLLILMAHLGIYIYLYLGLPNPVEAQTKIFSPKLIPSNQTKNLIFFFLIFEFLSFMCSPKTASSVCIILVA